MTTIEKIINIIENVTLDAKVENDTELIESEILDSFAIGALVDRIQKEFGITIDTEDLLPENFESAAAITKLVDSKK